MATISVAICDLGEADGGTTRHRLALDGTVVVIDLCAVHLTALQDAVAVYLGAGRPPPKRRPARTTEGRRRSAAIRIWAAGQDLLPAGSHGRLPIEVVAKYDAAHDGGAR